MKRLIIIIGCLCAITCAIQAGAWDITPFSNGRAEMPHASFHSTSAMPGINSSYTSHSSLNENGQATLSPTMRRVGGVGGGGVVIIEEPTDDDKELPLGDALIPLLLMVLAYGFAYGRKANKARV